MPRDYLSPPKEIRANKPAHAEWRELCRLHGPQVSGDSIADNECTEVVDLTQTSWCSIYALAVLAMKANGNASSDYSRNSLVTPTTPRPRHQFGEQFELARENALSQFKSFLADWKLADMLGGSNRGVRLPTSTETEWDQEKKILELHEFQSVDEISSHVLRWSENPLLEHNELLYHPIVAFRGVDIICAELLANGIEHRVLEAAPAFVMAKLCMPRSARHAMYLHETSPYLTEHELQFYGYSARHNIPLLQICIGDLGAGFSGGEHLVSEFKRVMGRDHAHDGELIEFVLDENYSSKTPAQRAEKWAGVADIPQTIHGLSEVARTVELAGGFWRIHSNGSGLDINAWSDRLHHSTKSRRTPIAQLRPVPGCLHYLTLPLKPRLWPETVGGQASSRASPGKKITKASQKASPLKLADSIPGTIVDSTPFTYTIAPLTDVQFEKLQSDVKGASGIVFIDVNCYDILPETRQEAAWWGLVDWLHRMRDRVAAVIVGANDRSESYLTKHISTGNYRFDHRLLFFCNLNALSTGSSVITIRCSEQHRSLIPILVELLTSSARVPILEEDWEPVVGDAILAIAKHNVAWFRVNDDDRGKWEVSAKVSLDINTDKLQRLAFGARDFAGLSSDLEKYKAVAKFTDSTAFRFGQMIDSFVHLGRLWAQREFRQSTVQWAGNCIRKSLGNELTSPHSVALVAMLHPSIDLARELLLVPEFSQYEVVCITRRADARWDFEPLLKTPAKRAILILDVCETGNLAVALSKEVAYLGLEIVCRLSLLAIGDGARRLELKPHFTFVDCAQSELIDIAASFPTSETWTIIDTDSQFTTQVDKVYTQKPALPERVGNLIRGGHLRFGHWEFGRHHTSFGILLRTLDGKETSLLEELLSDISNSTTMELGAPPDLIIVPSDSTAIHLAHQIEDRLLGQKSDSLAFASLAFRSHGNYHLELELPRSFASRDPKSTMRVLFFDDSRSSGITELRVINAFERAIAKTFRYTPEVNWLTYTALERGHRVPFRPGESVLSDEVSVPKRKASLIC